MGKRWLSIFGTTIIATGILLLAPSVGTAQTGASIGQGGYYVPMSIPPWGFYPFNPTIGWYWANIHRPSRVSYFTYGIGPSTYRVFYPSAESPGASQRLTVLRGGTEQDSSPAHVNVRLPVGTAEIWLNGSRMSRVGTTRLFVTPALIPGCDYSYEIRALWTINGRENKDTRILRIQAGDDVQVDFTKPPRPDEELPVTPNR